MREELAAVQVLHFGDFELDLRTRELRKDGLRLKLEEKPLQVLELLVERADALVTRKELRDRLWPDSFVAFDRGINTAINTLRKTLGDTTESPRYIETRYRLGYRFVAPVGPGAASVLPKLRAAPFNGKSTVKPDLIGFGAQEPFPAVPFVTAVDRTPEGDALRFQLQRPGGERAEISLRFTATKKGGLNMQLDFCGAGLEARHRSGAGEAGLKDADRVQLASQR